MEARTLVFDILSTAAALTQEVLVELLSMRLDGCFGKSSPPRRLIDAPARK